MNKANKNTQDRNDFHPMQNTHFKFEWSIH